MREGYFVGGIQQVGIGIINLEEAWKWYIEMFGMDCKIFDDDSEARIMLKYTGGKEQSRRAILALNLQSGGGFELWQYKGRQPVSPAERPHLGDLGILGCKMKVKSIDEAYHFLKNHSVTLLGEPAADPSGKRTFFLEDPYENIFQAVEANNWFADEGKISGGSFGAIIGVSSIENSRHVYSDILGYDEVVYDKTGIFDDLAGLPGGKREIRRVLLKCSEPFKGFFSNMFGQSHIELISGISGPGKKTYKDRFWGDPGFIHLCYDVRNLDELKRKCAKSGSPFVVDSRLAYKDSSFDMGEAAGHFAYIEDPDGTLIEFVETHKLPILKKFGWYLDLKKRKNYKPLPDWMVKLLRFSRVKPKNNS
jgi:catechol 2,3-dioxygenase-like lactoylglutathione lyase family enzyme